MENKFQIKWFEELDSTNDELLRHIASYDILSVVAAVRQTAGRGQRGNHWLSAPGDNLTFSLVLKPSALPAREAMAISCWASLAVREALRGIGVPAVIKWPNDLYVGNRKIVGMLVENGLAGTDIGWSVVGIGINLNQVDFPGELMNATSVRRITGESVDPASFLETLCGIMGDLLPRLGTPEGRASLRSDYEEELFRKDISATYRNLLTGKEFTGILRGITPEGLLCVESEGVVDTFGFKEISYIL